MTAPTRRQIMAASIAAGGALAVPAIAHAVTPEERVRLALAELEAAFQAYYPRDHVEVQFNGVRPADMVFRPHPSGNGYWGPKCAGALVFASVNPKEHGRFYKIHDDDINGPWPGNTMS